MDEGAEGLRPAPVTRASRFKVAPPNCVRKEFGETAAVVKSQ